VTEAELEELLEDCPVLYHMAERGSWPSIQQHGLLSTSALLDLYEIAGQTRIQIEATRRGASVQIDHVQHGSAVVRDQLPMDDKGLVRCLQDGLTPSDWYRLLNARVFFWLTAERLGRLLRADAYADSAHDVLELHTRSLVEAYRDSITLSPINSGCTKPFPHERGLATFKSIGDYPYADWRKKRKKGERVVELSVMGGVPDITGFVKRVLVMRGDSIEEILFDTA
jgi:hypothetical protein